MTTSNSVVEPNQRAAAWSGAARAAALARAVCSSTIGFLSAAAVILLFGGCVTRNEALTMRSGISTLPEPQTSRFGTLALDSGRESIPASTGFQKGKGKKGTVREAIRDSAEVGLSAPGLGVFVAAEVASAEAPASDPIGQAAIAGAVGTVAAVGAFLVGPAVGAEGLIRSMKKVTPEQLAEGENRLHEALSQMAEQKMFHQALVQAGTERIRGGFLPVGSENVSANSGPDCILEAHVDDIKLEHADSTDGSYFLHITTHARLVRVADGVTCFEQHAEYRSGTSLFFDWTLHGAIEGVAQTGYQTLAEYYVAQLLRDQRIARAK